MCALKISAELFSFKSIDLCPSFPYLVSIFVLTTVRGIGLSLFRPIEMAEAESV